MIAFVFVSQGDGGISEIRTVVRGGVAAHSAIIDRLRRVSGIRVILGDLVVSPLRFGPVLFGQGETCESHFQVSSELFLRQIPFQSPAFFSVRVGDKDGRGPERIEPVEVAWIFFYVYAEGDEIFVNERRQTGVRVRLVFEPLAGSSIWGRTEVDQQRLVLFLRLL